VDPKSEDVVQSVAEGAGEEFPVPPLELAEPPLVVPPNHGVVEYAVL
jgi:hypothetical protein